MRATALAAVVAGSTAAAVAETGAWREVARGTHGEPVRALALHPESGQLALGDARGVQRVDADGRVRRVLQRSVRDLAFLRDGGDALLVATDDGVVRVERERLRFAAPGPGAEARDVRRIAVVDGVVAAATAAGLYLSRRGERWQRASNRLPRGAASAVALRARADAFECWAVLGGRLWRLVVAREPDRFVAREPSTVSLPGGDAPVDVVLDVGGADAVALLPRGLAVRETPDAPWRRLAPALPPGAQVQRLAAARGRLWLATDRGLFAAEALAGPWRRIGAASIGSAVVHALAVAGERLVVAADDRALEERAAPPVIVAADAPARRALLPLRLRTVEGDPPIQQLQRAVLRHLELDGRPIAALRSGVARRGWLPVLALRIGQTLDRARSRDHDQTFSSGETRDLFDRGSDENRDFEAVLSLSWDLGDVAYHPEAIDVSREAREVVKLRDDVLDEVNQLYFERRRVLAELAALTAQPHSAPAEVFRLELRAAELAAGIDAWTGGWFTRARLGEATGP